MNSFYVRCKNLRLTKTSLQDMHLKVYQLDDQFCFKFIVFVLLFTKKKDQQYQVCIKFGVVNQRRSALPN